MTWRRATYFGGAPLVLVPRPLGRGSVRMNSDTSEKTSSRKDAMLC